MNYEPKSIADHIACLARLTGAPRSFVVQVKNLFSNKGISLDSDATPYVRALEDAFKREEHIRNSTLRARRNIERLQGNFARIGRAYVRQLDQVKRVHSRLRETSRRLSRSDDQILRAHEISIPGGDHRTLVTRPQREELPLVPGPDDLQ